MSNKKVDPDLQQKPTEPASSGNAAKLTQQRIRDFVSEHRLPKRFFRLIEEHYSRLAEWLLQRRPSGRSLFLGINGAQGTGKSTLAAYLQLVLKLHCDWQVAVLSIDDFYLTIAEREQLGKDIHPLLATRGVPGTHNVAMLAESIDRLRALLPNASMPLPRFDKARDARSDPLSWPTVSGPIDLIILEGWCVGSLPQSTDSLLRPVNDLEALQDKSGTWRRYVNEQLGGPYAEVFRQLDALVFLQAPNFDAVYRWRIEQEAKLAATAGERTAGIMSREQIEQFVQHYERLTRANLANLPAVADVVLELNDDHDCEQSRYTKSAAGYRQRISHD